MAVSLYAANNNYLDDVPTDKLLTFEKDLHGFMASKYKKLIDDLEKTKDLSDENAKELVKAIEDFKTSSSY